MKDFYQQIMEEHPDVDKKVLSKFLKSFTYPNITLNSDFSLSLKKKISRKIRQMDEKNYLEYLKLIPARIKFRYRLGGFAAAMFAFLFIFVVVFFSDFFSDQLFVPSKYIQVDSKFETPDTDNMKNNLMESRMMFVDAMLFGVKEEENYLYDGRKYPKAAAEMSVYKSSGSLVNEGIMSRYVENMKFGGMALKGFGDMGIAALTMGGHGDNVATIDIDLKFGIMNVLNFPVTPISLRDSKNFMKGVEKSLKSLKIPLSIYGSPEQKGDGILFYPFLLQGKYRVWDPENNQPQGMWVFYDRSSATLSVHGINIAKYIYTNYPTLGQEEVLQDFTVGIKKLDAPEVIYLSKYVGDEIYYLPGLRFVITEEKALYKELVKF